MSLKSGFFDAVEIAEGVYDRVYAAAEFAHYFALLVGNGVFPTPKEGMNVKASEPASMVVNIGDGSCWINGYYATVEGGYSVTVDPAEGSQKRIDSIVAQWRAADREIRIISKKGTPGTDPEPVTLQRDAELWEIELAQITLEAGISNIQQTKIDDTRADKDRCGVVTAMLDAIDPSSFLAQSEAKFNEWFDTIKGQISGDVAGSLLAMIDDLRQDLQEAEKRIMGEALPVGRMVYDKRPEPYEKYLVCNGAYVSKTEYLELFEKLGYDLGTVSKLVYTINKTSSNLVGFRTDTGKGDPNLNMCVFPNGKKILVVCKNESQGTTYVQANIIDLESRTITGPYNIPSLSSADLTKGSNVSLTLADDTFIVTLVQRQSGSSSSDTMWGFSYSTDGVSWTTRTFLGNYMLAQPHFVSKDGVIAVTGSNGWYQCDKMDLSGKTTKIRAWENSTIPAIPYTFDSPAVAKRVSYKGAMYLWEVGKNLQKVTMTDTGNGVSAAQKGTGSPKAKSGEPCVSNGIMPDSNTVLLENVLYDISNDTFTRVTPNKTYEAASIEGEQFIEYMFSSSEAKTIDGDMIGWNSPGESVKLFVPSKLGLIAFTRSSGTTFSGDLLVIDTDKFKLPNLGAGNKQWVFIRTKE